MPKDKVISYFSKYRIGQNAASHQENGIPLMPRNRDDRKVLVDEGNKCVAPAKSRPKKRKTVKALQLANKGGGGGDGSPLRPTEAGSPDVAEAVLWSDQVYTVRHLVKQFDGQFPVIVRVDEGHYREGVVDLARGQVLLVSDHGKQQRVLARNNSTETLLSLPVDYRMDIVTSSAEVVDFTTAMKEMELPFTATVYSVSPLSNTSHGNLTGEELTFLSMKDSVFLRANSISRGWVDQSEILVIPELVQVQFSVSEGLQGGTEKEWHDYQGMFARCVRHLSFSSMTGFQGIILEGPGGNEFLLASTCCLTDTDPITAQSETLQAAMERKKQRIAYENNRLSVTNQNKEGHENNLRLNAEDRTNDADDIFLRGQFSAYDNIALSETPENVEVLSRSGLDRHPSDVRVVSCSNSTLDYRRPREDRDSKEEPASVSTHGNGRQTSCSVVSKTNSEIINQLFDGIVDQTLVTAESNSEALGPHRNIQPVMDGIRQEETPVNLGSNQAGGSFVEDTSGQVHGKSRDTLNTNSIEMDTEREVLNKKESTMAMEPGPINKVNVLQYVSKFQSPNKPQTDDARHSGHPLQRAEVKPENKHADTSQDHANPPKPSGLEKPKPVITEKPKPAQVNRIQPPQRPPSTVANGVQEEPSRQTNRWQQPQKPEKPLHDSEHQTRMTCSSSKPLPASAQPPPLSRTPLTSKPLPESNPNRISQIQNISNRKTNDCVSAASAIIKPTPPGNPVVQRSSLISDVEIKSSADVPSELESLSVAGVSQCLELLHLDKHVTEFNRNAVDGRKLTDLTEKVLERQFHFNPLDASKLVRFVRGWRP